MRDILFVKHLLPEDEEITEIAYSVFVDSKYSSKANIVFDLVNKQFSMDNWNNLGTPEVCMDVLDEVVNSFTNNELEIDGNEFYLKVHDIPDYGDVLFHAIYGDKLYK